ncbi:MAG: ROK family protein [Patescibacteria group bacterium]
MKDLAIGVDLGGTKIATVLVGPKGEVLAEDQRPTEAERGVEAVIDRLADSARAAAGGRLAEVAAVGLGAPGPLNISQGLIFKAPNLPGWDNVPVARMLGARLGMPISLENDANAAAYAEWAAGAGRGARDMIYLTISTGIGGGLIAGGRLHHGRDDAAGEVGHMTVLPEGPPCGCGRRGCWETLCSGTAIAAEMVRRLAGGAHSRAQELAGGDPAAITAAHVAQAAREGDPVAASVLERAFFFLALGITNLIHLLNPDTIVIGGGVAKLGDQLFGPVRALVRERAYPTLVEGLPIVPAALGGRSGSLGAALVARARQNKE